MAWHGVAWLGLISKAALMLQERDQLKARARDEAAALEARKNKVTVTVDLLGRQVTSISLGCHLAGQQDVAMRLNISCMAYKHELYSVQKYQ